MPFDTQVESDSKEAPVSSTEAEWKAVADELAFALQATILRNPNLAARDWERAHAALGEYEKVAGAPVRVPEAVLKAPEG
jgi:hypothetical protein